MKIYADGSWTSEAPEWLTVTPNSGNGTITVTVSVTDNESTEGRVGYVTFAPELYSTTNVLTVQQKGDNKVTIKTGQAFADWLAGLHAESLDEARIANDLDMTGIELTPAKNFAGTLDGGGFAIKNLHSAKPLFKINKGTLKNIVIDASCSFVPDTLLFGAIVARNEGVVQNCINRANVTRTIEATDNLSNVVGGLIGLSVPTVDDGITISGCKNYGNVSIVVGLDKDNGEFTTQGVGGVVGYSRTPLDGCENHGDVTLSGGWHGRRACPIRDPQKPNDIESGEFYNVKVGSALGGVVAWAIGSLNKCKNFGKVSWTESRVENMNTSPARFFTGGLSGTYYGVVTDCSNEGEIVVRAVSSNGNDFSGWNHQQCIGGLFGGFDNPSSNGANSKNRGGKVSGCTNGGAITVEANTSSSPLHIGGISGFAAAENDNTDPKNWGLMSDCSNIAPITVSGTANLRVGGLVGAAPYMESCTNTGKITINGAKDYSEVGGVAARHWGYAQTIKNCSSHADIESRAVLDVGGLIGWIGKKVSATVEGGSFSGSITSAAGSDIGLLVGGSGNPLTATIGTSINPVEVSGSVNGTALTSGNASALLWGAGFDSELHTLFYVIK